MATQTDAGVAGQQSPTSANSEFSQHAFHMEQMMGRAGYVKLVKISKLKGTSGAVGKASAVDVSPLTKQMNGVGETQSHGTAYNLLYFRHQGGDNAIILDPKAGDMGYAIICDRDISANKKKGGEAQPGSYRRNNLADGIYMGGVMNAAPKSYVRWLPDGSIVIQPIEGDNLVPAVKWDNTDKILYLGGDPEHIPKNKFAFVSTVSGPCINVKGRFQI